MNQEKALPLEFGFPDDLMKPRTTETTQPTQTTIQPTQTTQHGN